jgi:cytochrome bd-type quinol oxidase subunit 1
LFIPDAPLTALELQQSIRKIMGAFYQFKYMVEIGLHIFLFPAIIFFAGNIKKGWRRWYRPWRNNLLRFGGWVIIKGWTKQLKHNSFYEQLSKAQGHKKDGHR